MSMQVDLRNPELGYFDEGMNLSDAAVYRDACLPFGQATKLPPVAYRSKVFLELESEKIWTRSWVAIGLQQQIPNAGDLLPMTIGMHGIHAQRQADGSISARMNRHQHGGCRFVPEQCRSGRQTKCSITSCNYTRDSDVMLANPNGENTDLMYKFVGLTPERLAAVKFETWGPFLFVNLDPECEPLATQLGGLRAAMGDDFGLSLTLSAKSWIDFKCNWKLAASALSRPAAPGEPVNKYLNAEACYSSIEGPYALSNSSAKMVWLFPNLLFSMEDDSIAVVLLQSTGVEKTLARCFWLAPKSETLSQTTERFVQWTSLIQKHGAQAEKTHRDYAAMGAATHHDAGTDDLLLEDNIGAYNLNQFLAYRLPLEHRYYWNAPIMDAAMMQRRAR